MSLFKRIFDIISQYKLVITIASFLSIYKSLIFLNIAIDNFIFYQFCILAGTFVVYNQNRVKSILITKNKSIRSQATLFLFLSMLIWSYIQFIVNYGVLSAALLLILFIPSILYQQSIIKYKKINLSIRTIPYLKIFLISFVWASISSMIILKINFNSSLIFILNFLFIFAITIPFDLRDREIDKVNNLKTLAHKFNDKQLIKISYFLLLLNLIFSIIFLSIIELSKFILAEFLIFIFLSILIYQYPKLKNKKYYFELIDFSIMLYGLLYLLIYIS